MSVAAVITMGYGSFGSVNRLPTIGYGNLNVTNVGAMRIAAQDAYVPGAVVQSAFVLRASVDDAISVGATTQDVS